MLETTYDSKSKAYIKPWLYFKVEKEKNMNKSKFMI